MFAGWDQLFLRLRKSVRLLVVTVISFEVHTLVFGLKFDSLNSGIFFV